MLNKKHEKGFSAESNITRLWVFRDFIAVKHVYVSAFVLSYKKVSEDKLMWPHVAESSLKFVTVTFPVNFSKINQKKLQSVRI